MANIKIENKLNKKDSKEILKNNLKTKIILSFTVFSMIWFMIPTLNLTSWWDDIHFYGVSNHTSKNIISISLITWYAIIGLSLLFSTYKETRGKEVVNKAEMVLLHAWYKKPYTLIGSYRNIYALTILFPFGVYMSAWFFNIILYGMVEHAGDFPWGFLLITLINTLIFTVGYLLQNFIWRLKIRKYKQRYGNVLVNRILENREMENDFQKPLTFGAMLWTWRENWRRDSIFWVSLFLSCFLLLPVVIKVLKKVVKNRK